MAQHVAINLRFEEEVRIHTASAFSCHNLKTDKLNVLMERQNIKIVMIR